MVFSVTLSFYTLITTISSNKIVLSNFCNEKNLIWLAYQTNRRFNPDLKYRREREGYEDLYLSSAWAYAPGLGKLRDAGIYDLRLELRSFSCCLDRRKRWTRWGTRVWAGHGSVLDFWDLVFFCVIRVME